MNYWLIKSDPDEYSFADLLRDGSTVWEGVSNNQALQFIRQMRAGDSAFVYHSGDEKQIVGIATIVSDPYPDPKANDDKLVVIDIKAKERLPRPVTLAQIKGDSAFTDFHLVRISRLSVMPVPPVLWKKLMALGGLRTKA